MPDGRSWELWEAESFLFNFASKRKMAGRKRKQRKIIGKVKRNRQRKKRKSERETEAEEGTGDERERERERKRERERFTHRNHQPKTTISKERYCM